MKWKLIQFVIANKDLFIDAGNELKELAEAIKAIVDAWNIGPDGQVPVMSAMDDEALSVACESLVDSYPELLDLVAEVKDDETEAPELEGPGAVIKAITLLVKLWPIIERLLKA